MPYYDVANLVTVTKTNIIDEMPWGYVILRTTCVRIRHQVSRKLVQRSPQLQNLTILIVKSCSILNATPSLQVLSGARENAPAQSESVLQSSRGSWGNLEVLKSTGEGYQSVWEVWVWLPDRITFCWCGPLCRFAILAWRKWRNILFQSIDDCSLHWLCCRARWWMIHDMDNMEASCVFHVNIRTFTHLEIAKAPFWLSIQWE